LKELIGEYRMRFVSISRFPVLLLASVLPGTFGLSLVLATLFIAIVRGATPTPQELHNDPPIFSQQEAKSTLQPDSFDCENFLPYAPDPNHIWNRVHRSLVDRKDAQGETWGCDEVDPLLWYESKHILASPAYATTFHLLDEFTSTHAERLIQDPLRRALFQRDLWAVFDWLARRADDHPQERSELEQRLAAIIKAIALTSSEIRQLPENYAQLSGSTTIGGLDLPDTARGWLLIGRDDAQPAAPIHSDAFPRSLFLVYLKLPAGGLAASTYLEDIREYSRERPKQDDCELHPCSPPQFSVGTEVALVRRALLIDAAGRPEVSPITESVQLRRYIKIPTGVRFDFDGGMQQVAEFQVTRRGLPQDTISLRRVGEDETQFAVFSTHGIDSFEAVSSVRNAGGLTLRRCHACHQGVGVTSFTTYSRVQFESGEHLFVPLNASTEARESAAAIKYLQARADWRLLQRTVPKRR
jgi:hypothetical protein